MKTNSPFQNYSAAILAGGKNKRFNGNIKSLAVFGNQTILQHQKSILKPLFSEILLITNQPDKFSRYTDLIICTDIIPGKGPLSGIHAALSNSFHKKIFIVAGDMPFINAQTISHQLETSEKKNYDAFIPRTNNHIEPLHGIYHRSMLAQLESILHSEKILSVKLFLEKIDVMYWDTNDNTPFININTPEELKHYEKGEHYKDKKR
jgi:molybdopterin-guanine dinucleotide biosynthesis protein A